MRTGSDSFVITKDVVLYADWVPGGGSATVLCPVKYHGNGNTAGTVPVDNNAWYPSGSTVTVLCPGSMTKGGCSFLGWATSSSATLVKYKPGATFTIYNETHLYAVWSAENIIIVPYNGRYAGEVGSKQTVVQYRGSLVIMCVESNLPETNVINKLDGSAVIENLIIDGYDANNNFVSDTTGLLLENVCNCLIRNVTIMNCEIGIKVKISDNGKSFGNRFEHIRMINVKKGILFEGTSTSKDFSYMTLDDVRISLEDPTADTGIQVGSTTGDLSANLLGAFVKATVWIDHSSHKGLAVYGSLKYSLVNLEVEQGATPVGVGVYVGSNATVSDNQSFLLTALLVNASNKSVTNKKVDGTDITVVP